jgi:DNA-nicking Smr family endonuclease
MKRPFHNAIPEVTASRRRRVLSEEEHALWDHVARQVKPLKKHRPPKVLAKVPLQSLAPEASVAKRALALKSIQAPVPPATKQTSPPLVPLGRRERTRLSRGRSEIDARLDLHGMTQTRAHRALSGFLQRAHQDGLTFVLVITGKGKMGGESGILRRQVPQWLSQPEFRAFVVGFEEAHIGHGGGGALYVRIRRARS